MAKAKRKKPGLKDGVILNEMPYKNGTVMFCAGKTEDGTDGHLFIFSGVEGYPEDHRILLKGGWFTEGDPRPVCHRLEREHKLYLAHKKLDDEHEEEYFGMVPICPEWDGCGVDLPPPKEGPPQSSYEVLADLMQGEKLCIQYALGHGESMWGPTVEHPLNTFCRGKAIFVYERFCSPESTRMSDQIENPTYLDIIKFANKCVYEDYPQDHIHLEGISQVEGGLCEIPVYRLQFGS